MDDVIWAASEQSVVCRVGEGPWTVASLPKGLETRRIAALPNRRAALIADRKAPRGDAERLAWAGLLTCGQAKPERTVTLEGGAFQGAVPSGTGFFTLLSDGAATCVSTRRISPFGLLVRSQLPNISTGMGTPPSIYPD